MPGVLSIPPQSRITVPPTKSSTIPAGFSHRGSTRPMTGSHYFNPKSVKILGFSSPDTNI
jgi:hypothetical protein